MGRPWFVPSTIGGTGIKAVNNRKKYWQPHAHVLHFLFLPDIEVTFHMALEIFTTHSTGQLCIKICAVELT